MKSIREMLTGKDDRPYKHGAQYRAQLDTETSTQPSTASGTAPNGPSVLNSGAVERPYGFTPPRSSYTPPAPPADLPLHQHGFRPRIRALRPPVQVFITASAYKQICLVVAAAPKEVGWYGTVDRLPDGNFRIEEIFVPEQEVTETETNPSFEGLYKVMYMLEEQGQAGQYKNKRLLFWGHSHVRMSTSPSHTDDTTPLDFSQRPWFVRGIFNKRGRAEFTVFLFEEGYAVEDVPWAVVDDVTGEILPIRKETRRQFANTFGRDKSVSPNVPSQVNSVDSQPEPADKPVASSESETASEAAEPAEKAVEQSADTSALETATTPETATAPDASAAKPNAWRPASFGSVVLATEIVLPPQCRTTDEERLAVEAELATKLTEKPLFPNFIGKWFSKSDKVAETTPAAPTVPGNDTPPAEPTGGVVEADQADDENRSDS